MSTQNELTLTDDAISSIAKLLQVAILTGTDIVDNLRTLRLVEVDNKLTVSPDFVESFETNVQNMLNELEGSTVEPESQASPFDVTEG